MPDRSHGSSAGRRSADVAEHSQPPDLRKSRFTWKDPKRIAASLKKSAEEGGRRKADPYRSAIAMLTFYVNRAGKDLSAERVRTLKAAKDELRRQFGRKPPAPRRSHVARKRRAPDEGGWLE